jgi:hypothetical protein
LDQGWSIHSNKHSEFTRSCTEPEMQCHSKHVGPCFHGCQHLARLCQLANSSSFFLPALAKSLASTTLAKNLVIKLFGRVNLSSKIHSINAIQIPDIRLPSTHSYTEIIRRHESGLAIQQTTLAHISLKFILVLVINGSNTSESFEREKYP